jgi:hypothetical protein
MTIQILLQEPVVHQFSLVARASKFGCEKVEM